jgi:ARG and Rhodanese-Phosphatase-superfamily-associated Protein domain
MTTPETVLDHEAPFQLGDPVEHRGILVTALFPLRDPRAHYLALEVAIERGLRIEEVTAGGSVPELRVVNRLAEQVLLYDGEELVGAKQNRILNVSVLVGGKTELPIPVSCVEERRWRHTSSSFSSASHSASPKLRQRKARVQQSDPLARGISQHAVWEEVRSMHARLDVSSPTGASADAYRRWLEALTALEAAFPLQPGQSGAVLALGTDVCLDYVSRPDAFERLYPKLLRGYMLDALERLDGPAAQEATVTDFVRDVATAERTRRRSAGLGEALRFESAAAIGSGLELDGELLQLSAFSSESGSRAFGRIARPSSRRT